MENFAKKLAINHNVSKTSNKKSYPLNRLKENYNRISKAFDILSESVTKNVSVPPAGEWLLDNFYIIEEQYNSILNDLSIKEYTKLPSVGGVCRVQILARELVKYVDGNITEDIIENFINAYQTKRTLSMEEIWYFPLMLKIALIEHIRRVCDKIITSQLEKFKVESLIERVILGKETSKQKFYDYKNINLNGEVMSYIEYMIYSLKKMGQDGTKYIEILEDEIVKAGMTSSEIIKIEHYDMATRRISMSNAITSIKNISRFNWTMIFEKINNIENILSEDEVYTKMDFDTKALYREEIKKVSKLANVSEIYVANMLVELSEKENKHIGFFLFDDDKKRLYDEIGVDTKVNTGFSGATKLLLYTFGIYLPSIILSIVLFKEKFLWGIIPFSEVFCIIVNRIVTKIKKPRRLPRMEEISEDVGTFVIVPTLLNSKERVKKLVNDLEVYYLANRDAKLYFCLLGDTSEIDSEIAPYDEEIKKVGVEEVEKLNQKYNKKIFYFVYRRRVYNKSQGKWLGYERKRGMITEFNNFLLTGEQGTFQINTIEEIPKIKYIITLDADTELVLDSAQKLIGIMEHPLNKPIIENGIVKKGYGLIQPKIGVSIESSTASLFSKLYAGSGGLDMYSGAESNVYMDLFGEGIFTGKGIFNVDVFQRVLKDEIPENTVLSHDLLEGSYLRVGLASDIELIDGFPPRVNSYMLRLQRWTRGDIQIIKWFANKKINALSKYKIFDNVRRSILDISVLILLFMGFPKSALFILFFPFIMDVISTLFNFKTNYKKTKNFFITINGMNASLYRCIMALILLPYKAVLLIEAIVITLYRMFISKKHLLEWVTAADAEKLLGKDLKCYIKEMIISPIVGIGLLLTYSIYHKNLIITGVSFLVAWFMTPFISYLISKENTKKIEKPKENDKKILLDIAKRTWNYFDKYMTKENNFIPPDNYQENRKKQIVKNTSSTNIGLRTACDNIRK